MRERQDQDAWCLPEDVAQVHASPELGYIMQRWPAVGAVAWQGYQEHGRGTVMLDDEGCVQYCPGSPCDCHEEAAKTYDPEQQAVVALHHGNDIDNVLIVAGWPAPPDAFRITPGERLRLTSH